MTDDEILLDLTGRLNRLSIPYMIVGSFASSIWGRPRATNDTDVVLQIATSDASRLRAALEPDYYVPDPGLEDALMRRGMVNAIHQSPVWKFDLIVRSEEPFQRAQFERRIAIPFRDATLHVASPEDTILAKLDWSRRGESERQFRDALGVFEVQKDRLDRGYLERWADALNLRDLLVRLESEAV